MTDAARLLPDELPVWKRLVGHAARLSNELAKGRDPRLARRQGLAACGIELDPSRARLDDAAVADLTHLASERAIERQRDAMFNGDIVNRSEKRQALHTALRAIDPTALGEPAHEVLQVRQRMRNLAEALHAGELKGATGEPITDIVNIGIGGSDFGSRLLCDALTDRAPQHLKPHFVSGLDGVQVERLCRAVDPRRTLFIVSSKSFETIETLTNARTLMQWFAKQPLAAEKHWFAVTGRAEAAERFGIARANVLDVPAWAGGRFSAWGAVGLPAALYLGWPVYSDWLSGGAAMDEHHRRAPLETNLPVRLGIQNVWHSTFLGCPTHCIVSYDNRLSAFLSWAQQLEMESNGKSVSGDGRALNFPTAPVVWGGLGNDGQHTYYQLLREGTRRTAVTLITVDTASAAYSEHAEALKRQADAQSEALTARESPAGFNSLTRLRLRDLEPSTLGALMAAFEHATTVAAWIWGINPFDQPGVELGKRLAANRSSAIS